MDRRELLKTLGLGLVGGAIGNVSPDFAVAGGSSTESAAAAFKKSLKLRMVEEELPILEIFQMLREIGFDGVDVRSPREHWEKREELLRAQEETGLSVPTVVNLNPELTDPDAAVREKAVESLKSALSEAAALGADSVLLYPTRVTAEVAYDEAYHRSQREISKALPVAEEHGVRIAIENVWNRFLMSPMECARYIDEFESSWIGVHFDMGNVIDFGYPDQWIRILGDRIVKLDIKDFSREKANSEGAYAGFDVNIGEGSCDWSRVRKALANIGYEGWVSAEVAGGDRKRLAAISERMDRVLEIG